MRPCSSHAMAKTGKCSCGNLFVDRGIGALKCGNCIVSAARARREQGLCACGRPTGGPTAFAGSCQMCSDTRRAERATSPSSRVMKKKAEIATCRCGGFVVVLRARGAHEVRCGACVKADNKERRSQRSRVKSVWRHMIKRCTDSSDAGWRSYGGRGIKVCKRWMDFEKFYLDMGPRAKGMSIERIDVNGDYCPENCIWIERKLQNRNQRRNKLTESAAREVVLALRGGEETRVVAERYGITVSHALRVRRGRYWKGVAP